MGGKDRARSLLKTVPRSWYSEGMEDRSPGGSGDTGRELLEDWRADFRQLDKQ